MVKGQRVPCDNHQIFLQFFFLFLFHVPFASFHVSFFLFQIGHLRLPLVQLLFKSAMFDVMNDYLYSTAVQICIYNNGFLFVNHFLHLVMFSLIKFFLYHSSSDLQLLLTNSAHLQLVVDNRHILFMLLYYLLFHTKKKNINTMIETIYI